MESAVSETMQTGGSGVKAEPGKMHASKHAEHMQGKGTHARREEKRERGKEERKKRED